jgi:hypothetical protein
VLESSIKQINEATPGLKLIYADPSKILTPSSLVIRLRKNLEDGDAAWTIHNLFKAKNPII